MSNLSKWKRALLGTIVGGIISNTQSSWVDPDTPAVEKVPQPKALTPGDDRQYNLVRNDRPTVQASFIQVCFLAHRIEISNRCFQTSLTWREEHSTTAMTHVGLLSTKMIVSKHMKAFRT